MLAIFSVLAAAFYFDDRRRSLHRLEDDLARIAAGDVPPAPPRVSMATFGNRWERIMVASYLEARPELLSRAATPARSLSSASSALLRRSSASPTIRARRTASAA